MLAAGTRLGPYEIVAPLGAGGMGEVYRARDTRLDRSVAVKVLPAEFARDEKLRQRFEREARSISQLSHPHICTLYDVGRDGDRDYLVMELLEGESLADRLGKGPLPLPDVLRYGVQVADALARAHRQGIVHRDLKPGNVMITRSGAKLLDFGLSKTAAAATFAADAPTQQQHKPLTAEGTIVGTFQYMAPEQLEGVEADPRTDIFALGCVLYEMLTGERAFQGATRTSLIAAIVSAEPRPVTQVQPLTPPALEHVIRKCLEKQPDDRWQSAHDVASELRWISEAGSQASVVAPLTRRRKRRERLAWIAGLAAVAALAAWGGSRLGSPVVPSAPVVRAEVRLEPPLRAGWPSRHFDISPDGKWLAYAATTDAVTEIYLRRLDGIASTRVPGTRGAVSLFFSADSKRLGFQVGESDWYSVPIEGGGVEKLVDCDCWTPSWASNGSVLFATERGIESVDPTGSLTLLVRRPGDAYYGHPTLLEERDVVIFAVESARRGRAISIAAYDLRTRRLHPLTNGTAPRMISPQHLAYMNGDALTVATLDVDALRLTGHKKVIAAPVARHPVTSEAFYSFSPSGVVAYFSGTTTVTDARLVWIDRQGKVEPLQVPPRPYGHPRISEDGSRIVFAIRYELTDVWGLELKRNVMSRLTFVPTENEMPLWVPRRNEIVFSSSRADDPRIHFSRPADGSGQERRLFATRHHQHLTSISPDGTTLLATEFHPERGADILTGPLTGPQRPLIASQFDEMNAQFSPDGKWIAYTSLESGRQEVYVIGANGSGKWQVSAEGGHNPVWSRDGRELFYLWGRKMFVLDVTAGETFSPSIPRQLFEADFELLPRGDTNYDVTPDGQRFVMVQTDASARAGSLTLLTNWLANVEPEQGTRGNW